MPEIVPHYSALRSAAKRVLFRRATPFLLSMFFIAVVASAQEWPSYGNDPGGRRYSPLTQINRVNVATLAPAWTYHMGELDRDEVEANRHHSAPFESTPIVVNGILYFSTPSSRVIALDSDTGAELWQFDPQAANSGRHHFYQHRGVAYWQSADTRDSRILYGTFDGRLIALNAKDGRPCRDFGKNGEIDLRPGASAPPFGGDMKMEYSVTSPPAIYQNLAIVSAAVPEFPTRGPSGMVRAFDVRTGKLVWTFHTIPQPGEPHHDSWSGDSWRDRTGANVWSIMSVDVERGLLFLPVGSASYDFYGADRQGDNLFSNSLVALDAATGKLVWFYQMVHHDVWDYDLPAQPVLITIHRDKKEIPAIVQVTKMGYVFVLDRETGKPLFPVEERPFPKSTVPGESASPTQPVPVKPPPLARQSLTAREITAVSPESQKYCADFFKSLEHHGMYGPYGQNQTLVFPGSLGGANWSGAAFDPTSGYLFVNVNELGAVGALEPQPPGSPEPYRRANKEGEYARFWDKNRLPCQQPPWGTLNAVDLNKGEIVWKVPLGFFADLKVKTGTPNLGGSIIANGVVFIGATMDNRFRAFDAKTGEELWSFTLNANAHATPLTYWGKKSHKQFVAIAVGGGGSLGVKVSDEVIAFALPAN